MPIEGPGSMEGDSTTTRALHQWLGVGLGRMRRCRKACPTHESVAKKREQHGHQTISGPLGHSEGQSPLLRRGASWPGGVKPPRFHV